MTRKELATVPHDDTAPAVSPQSPSDTIDLRDLLVRCYAAGVRLEADDNGIRLERDSCPDELFRLIEIHVVELTTLLRDEGSQNPISAHEFENPHNIHHGEVLRKADELREPLRFGIGVIVNELATRFAKSGVEHGDVLLDIVSGYRVCLDEAWEAAKFLAARGVIELRDEGQTDDDCQCAPCCCRRNWVQFPYDLSVDYELLKLERQQEAERRRAVERAKQIANEHRTAKYLRSGEGIVYLIRTGPRHKIGITTHLQRRIDQLKAQAPFPLEVVHTATGKRYAQMESQLHRAYQSCRVHGEWFDLSPDQVAAVIESMNEWAAKGGD